MIYLFYGRRHSEVNNPRLVQDDPMRVVHENFSVDTVNYRGFNDEHLRRQYERQLGRRLGGPGGESSGRVSERSGLESGVIDDREEYLPDGSYGVGTPLSRRSSNSPGGRLSPVSGAGRGGQEMAEIGVDRMDGTGVHAREGGGGGPGIDHIYQQRLQQLQQITQQQRQQTLDESDGSGVGRPGTGSGSGSGSRSKSRSAYVAPPSMVARNGSGDSKDDIKLGSSGGGDANNEVGQLLNTPHSPTSPPPRER